MPALIGLAEALPLILTGKTLRPRQALRIGLVDEIVSPEGLLQIARQKAVSGKKTPRSPDFRQRLLSVGPIRQIYFRIARRQAEQKVVVIIRPLNGYFLCWNIIVLCPQPGIISRRVAFLQN